MKNSQFKEKWRLEINNKSWPTKFVSFDFFDVESMTFKFGYL